MILAVENITRLPAILNTESLQALSLKLSPMVFACPLCGVGKDIMSKAK